MRILLIVAIALCSSLRTQGLESGTGAVTGHVTCADSRTPCRFASVTIQTVPPHEGGVLAKAAEPTHSYAAVTDLDGAFTMGRVLPGEYYVTALQPGYLSPYDLVTSEFEGDPALKPKAVEIVLERVVVVAGQTTTANLLLVRGASLSGTVGYDDGGPAVQVSLHLFRRDGAGKWQKYQNSAGTNTLAVFGFAPKTDDRGRFYAPGLPAGTYTVEAELPVLTTLLSSITERNQFGAVITESGALQVFYGDVYRQRQAKPVEVHAGEERSDVDITMPTSGLHTVRGVVSGRPDGRAVTSGRIQLLDPEDQTVLREFHFYEDGSFVFRNLATGTYTLKVECKGEEGTATYEPFSAPLLVEADVLGLTYRLSPAKR